MSHLAPLAHTFAEHQLIRRPTKDKRYNILNRPTCLSLSRMLLGPRATASPLAMLPNPARAAIPPSIPSKAPKNLVEYSNKQQKNHHLIQNDVRKTENSPPPVHLTPAYKCTIVCVSSPIARQATRSHRCRQRGRGSIKRSTRGHWQVIRALETVVSGRIGLVHITPSYKRPVCNQAKGVLQHTHRPEFRLVEVCVVFFFFGGSASSACSLSGGTVPVLVNWCYILENLYSSRHTQRETARKRERERVRPW